MTDKRTAEQNRRDMPNVTAFIDECRRLFGDVRVTFAQENGITLGREPVIVGSCPPRSATRAER
jgi:hypothetical protein